MRRLVGLLLALAGCGPTPPPRGSYALAMEGWQGEERAAVVAALDGWRDASRGWFDVHPAAPNERADCLLVRGGELGEFSRIERKEQTAWINVDALRAAGFTGPANITALTANVIARIAGMRPHEGDSGVLSKTNITAEWTEEDIASCRNARLCERLEEY